VDLQRARQLKDEDIGGERRQAERLLSSWKEIAKFLGKGVRTVQRWEREIGLPIHRPAGAERGRVLALESELRDWVESGQKQQPITGETSDPRMVELMTALAAARVKIECLQREVELLRAGHDTMYSHQHRRPTTTNAA
jgi:hypothetical protein